MLRLFRANINPRFPGARFHASRFLHGVVVSMRPGTLIFLDLIEEPLVKEPSAIEAHMPSMPLSMPSRCFKSKLSPKCDRFREP